MSRTNEPSSIQRISTAVCLFLLIVLGGGCSTHHLPEPRLPDDEAEAEVDSPAVSAPPPALPVPASSPNPAANQAVERLESTFALNVVKERLAWIEAASKQVKTTNDASLLADQAVSLFELALQEDAFEDCRKVQSLFLALARRANDNNRVAEAQRIGDRLDVARKEHAKIAEHLHVLLRSSRDPQAHQQIGKYLWLVKHQWARGAEHLARGPDGPLKQAALLELRHPAVPEDQAALGDLYWSLAELSAFARSAQVLKTRAANWYRQALPQHPDGLRKALIQERIRVAEESDENELRDKLPVPAN